MAKRVLLVSAVMLLASGNMASGDGLRFADFAGCVQGNPNGPLWDHALGWDRHDLSWAECAPAPDAWNQDYLDNWGQRVLDARERGAQVLPILAYNARWSWDRGPRTFGHGNTRKQVTPLENGNFRIATFRKTEDGAWKFVEDTERSGGVMFPLAAEHVPDWEAFVRRVVSFLRKPPYEVEYFEIWNEAHPDSGFWIGGMDEYMERVHLPAARIIRELGRKVVYGGYPACGSIYGYVKLLDRHQAWGTLDVSCVHYFGLNALTTLRRAAAERGFNEMGVWQTEVGFTSNPAYIANVYPRAFYWALKNGLAEAPERFKLFYFAFWSPNDPNAFGYGKTLLSGDTLSNHGKSLLTLGALFGNDPVRTLTGVHTEPPLHFERTETSSSIEAFQAGKRIVVAVHWVSQDPPDTGNITLAFDSLPPESISRICRYSAIGSPRELSLDTADRPNVQVTLPIAAEEDLVGAEWWGFEGEIRTFYVLFEAR
jgi:hypothetical protein